MPAPELDDLLDEPTGRAALGSAATLAVRALARHLADPSPRVSLRAACEVVKLTTAALRRGYGFALDWVGDAAPAPAAPPAPKKAAPPVELPADDPTLAADWAEFAGLAREAGIPDELLALAGDMLGASAAAGPVVECPREETTHADPRLDPCQRRGAPRLPTELGDAPGHTPEQRCPTAHPHRVRRERGGRRRVAGRADLPDRGAVRPVPAGGDLRAVVGRVPAGTQGSPRNPAVAAGEVTPASGDPKPAAGVLVRRVQFQPHPRVVRQPERKCGQRGADYQRVLPRFHPPPAAG